MSIFDDEHSEDEERWITLGLDRAGVLLWCATRFVRRTKPSVGLMQRYESFLRARRTEVKPNSIWGLER
jgi:hypothetical protein